MTYDWNRLAHRLRERRTELSLTQAEVALLAGVTPMTVRNLETGREFTRLPHSLPGIERALGWEPDSAATVLDGGDPTTAPTPPPPTAAENADPSPSTLPLSVRAALDDGETFDTEIIEWDVAGTPLHLVVVVKAGAYATDADRATLRHQMEEWARVKKGLRRLISDDPDAPSETPRE